MAMKASKIISIIMLAIILITSLTTIVNAETWADFDIASVTNNATDTSGAAKSINNIIGALITIVQVVGIGVAVIMLIILAIKYISAAPGDKADIKKHAVVYVVGAVILFATSGILGIIKNFASNIK